ncbi:MAG: hypothetical protein ACRD2O_12690, partial [Terriglobia bacterium]
SEKSHKKDLQLSVELISARVLAASGRPGSACQNLQRTLSDAKRLGYLGYDLETHLALGEIKLKFLHSNSGRTELQAAARDATDHGFNRIANRAILVLKWR